MARIIGKSYAHFKINNAPFRIKLLAQFGLRLKATLGYYTGQTDLIQGAELCPNDLFISLFTTLALMLTCGCSKR